WPVDIGMMEIEDRVLGRARDGAHPTSVARSANWRSANGSVDVAVRHLLQNVRKPRASAVESEVGPRERCSVVDFGLGYPCPAVDRRLSVGIVDMQRVQLAIRQGYLTECRRQGMLLREVA